MKILNLEEHVVDFLYEDKKLGQGTTSAAAHDVFCSVLCPMAASSQTCIVTGVHYTPMILFNTISQLTTTGE